MPHVRKQLQRRPEDAHLPRGKGARTIDYAIFMRELLAGRVKAERLDDDGPGQGNGAPLEYIERHEEAGNVLLGERLGRL